MTKYIKFDDGSIVLILQGTAKKIANHDEVKLAGRKSVNAGQVTFLAEADVEVVTAGESFTLGLKSDPADAKTIKEELFG